jgi:hypothetical protein
MAPVRRVKAMTLVSHHQEHEHLEVFTKLLFDRFADQVRQSVDIVGKIHFDLLDDGLNCFDLGLLE